MTILFTRQNSGVIPTNDAHEFYVFANNTLNEFKRLRLSTSIKKIKLLTSELLFNFVFQKNKGIITSAEITHKQTGQIDAELQNENYDVVYSFKKINNKNYIIFKKYQLKVCLIKSVEVTDIHHLPILINRDILCPLRKLSCELFKGSGNFIEIDSLNNILTLVSQGQGVSLLPQSLISDSLCNSGFKKHSITYYEYRINH